MEPVTVTDPTTGLAYVVHLGTGRVIGLQSDAEPLLPTANRMHRLALDAFLMRTIGITPTPEG